MVYVSQQEFMNLGTFNLRGQTTTQFDPSSPPPPFLSIQAVTHLSSSTDSHYLLSAGPGSRLCDQYGTSGWSGLSKRGVIPVN